MLSLSDLSDHELRKKLKEYGVTSPVTESTRNILLKKLNHLMASERNANSSAKSRAKARKQIQGDLQPDCKISPFQGSRSVSSTNAKVKNKRATTSLTSFSSEEEDDIPEVPHPRRSLRISRHEISQSNVPSSESSAESDHKTVSSQQPSFSRKPIPFARKTSKFFRSPLTYFSSSTSPSSEFDLQSSLIKSDYDTGSDSEGIEEVNKNHANIFRKYDTQKRSFGSEHSCRKAHSNVNYDFNSHISSGFVLDSSFYNDPREEMEITSPDDIVSQEPLMSYASQMPNGQSPYEQTRKVTCASSFRDSNFWLQAVPFVLLGLLALFFCFLGFCYLSIHSPNLPLSWLPSLRILHPGSNNEERREKAPMQLSGKDTDNFPICKDTVQLSCLSMEEARNVADLIPLVQHLIWPALSKQASRYTCRETALHYMKTDDLVTLLMEEVPDKSGNEIQLGLHGLGKLASIYHSELGLEPIWHENQSKEAPPHLIGLSLHSPPTEILCHLISALYTLAYFICGILLVLIAIWLGYHLFCYYAKRNEELERKSFELVEQILEVLENSCGTDGKEFIAVNHVRDCLIPPRDRKDKIDIWNKAVAFIDNHDSRVYREIRSVGGEDCEVWRWVSGAPRSPVSCLPKGTSVSCDGSPLEKVWQGQAFESLESTQNVPQISPTSCLKIRNMFDCELEFGEDWHWRIQDSLLEKCEGIKIVHVAVDKVSKEGCVYLKCSSPQDAGKAFRSLHGWWFDGNLVTVKYLRDERYHERFPTARLATTPLTPSNNKRLSLSQKLHSKYPPPAATPASNTLMKYSSIKKLGRSESSAIDRRYNS